ncbi:MAG: hypothetical protein ACLR2G_05480 [Phascolarctobacterium faecium]
MTEKLPKDGKRIVIMHATPSNVQLSWKTALPAVAKMLDFKYCCRATPKGKPEKTPYSMEALVERIRKLFYYFYGRQ